MLADRKLKDKSQVMLVLDRIRPFLPRAALSSEFQADVLVSLAAVIQHHALTPSWLLSSFRDVVIAS